MVDNIEKEKKLNTFFNRKTINIDISFRCPLECPRCQRQTYFKDRGLKVHGYDLSLNEIEKLSNFFTRFAFCGQLSDPVHHPKFPEILKILHKKNVRCEIHNAASQKSIDYYIECFKANPNAEWVFALDGLPKDSHKYRINQNGEKMFQIICESKKYLKRAPIWQYIVFSYNENDIKTAQELAKKNGITFLLLQSSRWLSDDDPYKPKKQRISFRCQNRN